MLRLHFHLLLVFAPMAFSLLWSDAHATSKRVKVIEGPILAHVVRVRDGDSIDVIAHVWPGTQIAVSVRLSGIDAPELRAGCDEEKQLATAARDRLKQLVGKGPIHLKQVRGGKYFGRILARVSANGTDVQKVLLNENLARPYRSGKRQSWCNSDRLARG